MVFFVYVSADCRLSGTRRGLGM